jgi:hypothetical protein
MAPSGQLSSPHLPSRWIHLIPRPQNPTIIYLFKLFLLLLLLPFSFPSLFKLKSFHPVILSSGFLGGPMNYAIEMNHLLELTVKL